MIAEVAAEIRRRYPGMSQQEAERRAADAIDSDPSLDAAPSSPISVDVPLDYPEQRYKYNPASREWEDVADIESRMAEQAASEQQAARDSGVYGGRWGSVEGFGSQEEADAYTTRPPGGPSQQDLDMLKTGETNPDGTGWLIAFTPDGRRTLAKRAPTPPPPRGMSDLPAVYGPDADAQAFQYMHDMRNASIDTPTPDYMQGFETPFVEQGWANEVTGNRRVGDGVDNRGIPAEMPQEIIPDWVNRAPERPVNGEYSRDQLTKMYRQYPQLVDTPNGPAYRYDYDPEYEAERRMRRNQQLDNLQMRRMADRAGITVAEARALRGGKDDLRDLIADRRSSDRRARENAVRARAMLAGANPGQNLSNAYMMVNDPEQYGLTEEGVQSLRYMLPGGDRLAGVEAANLDAAASLAGNAIRDSLGPMMAAAMGQGGEQPPQGPPSYDRVNDLIESGDYAHQDVYDWANSLVNNRFSTSLGIFSTSDFTDDEVIAARDAMLSRFPGMPADEAEAIFRDIQLDRSRRRALPFGNAWNM